MKPTINFADFDKLDLRIGNVVAASAPDWSNKLLELTIDFGPEIGEKTILTGVRQWYEPDYFIGNSYVFVVNLEPRKMGEGVSEGMLLMSDEEKQPQPFAITVPVTPGSVVR